MQNNTSSDSFEKQSHFSKMHTCGLLVEHQQLRRALSVDLAAHMAARYQKGKIAVVADHPQALMSSVRKQWIRLIRLSQREQASTLNRQRKAGLNEAIRCMQAISFTTKNPAEEPLAYVSFATVGQFIASPPQCATLYIAKPVTMLNQHMLVTWMPRGGTVVIYDE